MELTRNLPERIGSAACLAFVLAVLITVDVRVREHLWVAIGNGADGVDGWVERLQVVGSAVADALRYQSIEHAPLLIFTVLAVVLVLLMHRQ